MIPQGEARLPDAPLGREQRHPPLRAHLPVPRFKFVGRVVAGAPLMLRHVLQLVPDDAHEGVVVVADTLPYQGGADTNNDWLTSKLFERILRAAQRLRVRLAVGAAAAAAFPGANIASALSVGSW